MRVAEVYIERCNLDGTVEATTSHVVWDRELFLKTRQAEASSQEKPQFIRQITREQYRARIWPKPL